MSKRMADSVNPAGLPPGMDAYLGYTDGSWPDFAVIRAQHPGVPVFGLTVYLKNEGDGMDVEPGDATPAQSATYVKMRHGAGIARPIIYSSASNTNECRRSLDDAGLPRSSYRLMSAHYGVGPHICGNPGTNCGYEIDVDGTQWIDHGDWDESLLRDNFLDSAGPPPIPPPGPTVPPYMYPLFCPPIRQTPCGRQWQQKMRDRGWNITVDGWYGNQSKAICMAFQKEKGARVDGIVGPTTWNLTWTSPVS